MTIKEYVAKRKEELKKEIENLGKEAVLSIITVGNDPASEAYVRGKKKDAAEVGIKALHTVFPENVEEKEVLALIRKQNEDPNIHGIIVQLPLPKRISVKKINETLSPSKDVDGFTLGSSFDPCTPKGIVNYLTNEGFVFTGKNAVVLGRSEIVGKPMARMLLDRNCNVVQLHSKTSREDKEFYFSHADLIVSAVGRMYSWDETYLYKKDAYLIDVGINMGEDGHLHGDFVPNLPVKLQTPVPGGVGLLTRLALLENLLEATEKGE